MEIKDALATLDTLQDENWTADGSPRMDVLKALTGNEELTRQMIIDVAPAFSRENTDVFVVDPEPVEEEIELDDLDLEHLLSQDYKTVFAAFGKMGIDDLNEVCSMYGDMITIRQKKLEDLRTQISGYARMSDIASNLIQRMTPKGQVTHDIRKYIDSQNKAREQRAARRKQVLAGLDAEDIKDATQVSSKLDSAMKQRKPSLGAGRPTRGKM